MSKRDERASDEDAAAVADAAIGPELDSHVSRAYAPKRIVAVGGRMNGRTMKRTPMGPPASEPEQRDYAITITAPDGTMTSAGIVRSHHALDAAREAAALRGFGAALRESCAPSGMWIVEAASGHVVRAIVDTPQARAAHAMLRPESLKWTECASTPTDDERAATQRRIADAIREIPREAAEEMAAIILRPEYQGGGSKWWLVRCALAACAREPAILDAVRQVAQVHALTIRENEPSEGG